MLSNLKNNNKNAIEIRSTYLIKYPFLQKLNRINKRFILTLVILLFYITTPQAETTIIPTGTGCTAPNHPGTTFDPCYSGLYEEYFGALQENEALAACDAWTKTLPDPLDCNRALNALQYGAGNAFEPQKDGSLITWSGVFHFNGCPDGSTLDIDKGCIIEEAPCDKCDKIGHSINVAKGNEYHKVNIEIGNGLDISLSYNSQLHFNESGNLKTNKLAPGWAMSTNMYISHVYTIHAQKYVNIHRGDGRKIIYTYNTATSLWESEIKNNNKLEKTSTGWKYTNQSNQIETYDDEGKIQTLEFNNSILSFSHGLIENIINQRLNTLTFTSENLGFPNERFTEMTDDTERVWSFGYSGNNINANLTSITYPDGTNQTFHYDDGTYIHALTGITDRRNIPYVTYNYDDDGRMFNEQLAGGVEELTIDYLVEVPNSNIRTREITNSRVLKSTYTAKEINSEWKIVEISGFGCSTCSINQTEYEYYDDTNHQGNLDNIYRLKSKSASGKVTEYRDYDSKGQYGYKIEAHGTSEARRTDYTYDSRFFKKPLTITEPSVFTNKDKVTSYTYDDHANITSMTIEGHKIDGTTISSTTTYQYTGPFKQISSIDGPIAGNGDKTIFSYYSNKPFVTENNRRRLKKVTNAEGIVLRDEIQYSATGKLLSEDKPNGLVTSYTYYTTGNDRLKTISNNDGTKTITTHLDYLASGEIKEIIRNFATLDASILTLGYDNARRLTSVTDAQGNYVVYTLDTEGNQLSEETRDIGNNLKKLISQTFDDYDQINTSTQSGVINDMDYGSDGNLYQQTNGNNVVTDYDYDALNRLTKITQAYSILDVIEPDLNVITEFDYDVNDRVNLVTDANNNNTSYEYDDLGRLTQLTSPDTGIDVFTYDGAGNVLSKTDANGNLTSFTYDATNRPLSIDYVGTNLDVTFVYDQGINGLNQLTSFSDSKSSTTLSYDTFGNLLNKSQTVLNVTANNNVTSNLSYTYDNANRMDSMTYPSGQLVNYYYNNLNQIEKITTSINGQNIDVVKNVSYLPMGPLNNMDMGNDLKFTGNYDNGYRLDNYDYSTVLLDPVLSGTFGYDGNHNIKNLIREPTGNSDSFDYDKLDRVEVENGNTTSYTYDKLGNRRSSTTGVQSPVIYTYDANSNKLLNVGTVKPRMHDNNGNTTAIKSENKKFFYNKANRMSSFKIGKPLKAKYFYNGIGQRIYKKYFNNNNVPLYFIYQYNANGQLIHESKYQNNNLDKIWSRETIWLNNKPVAQIRTTYSGGVATATDLYYILSDHLNTPRKVTYDTGTVLWSWNSDAFGTTLPNEDVDGDTVDFVFNLRFPGQYFDVESGEHYNYFRDYEPGTGRYLESDPIGLRGGVNTFGYVENNPTKMVDPYGLKIGILRGITRFLLPWWNDSDSEMDLEHFDTELCENCMYSRKKGGTRNDPVTLQIVNPGKCNGKCNPCPDGASWWVNSPGHGNENGFFHVIKYNQVPYPDCTCFPDRPSQGLPGA